MNNLTALYIGLLFGLVLTSASYLIYKVYTLFYKEKR